MRELQRALSKSHASQSQLVLPSLVHVSARYYPSEARLFKSPLFFTGLGREIPSRAVSR